MTQTAVTTWNIDPAHTVAEFKVKHMMISNVKGQFAKVSGVLTLDEADVTKSSVEASIDVASIGTNDAQRDGHLKSADFFDVEKFPAMTFKSTGVKVTGAGEGTVEGDLTIRVCRGRANGAGERSLGQFASCGFGDDKDQPQGFRVDLECSVGDGWRVGGR